MDTVLLWLVTVFLFGIGLLGIFIPALPGVGIIFLGILIFAAATHFASISVAAVIALGVVAFVAWLAEFIGSGVAARMGGGGSASFWGTSGGAIIGTITGGPPGLILGALVGAWLGALTEGHSPHRAGTIALYSVVGLLGAKIAQLGLGVLMIITFFIALAW